MSHYTKLSIQAQQKFESELLASLKKHFGETKVEMHEKKASLKTYAGADSGLKANIIVRKQAQGEKLGRYMAVNDLGYERNTQGGYDVHADLDGYSTETQNLIAKDYAERVATKQLKAKGYTVKRKELTTGEVQLVAQRYG